MIAPFVPTQAYAETADTPASVQTENTADVESESSPDVSVASADSPEDVVSEGVTSVGEPLATGPTGAYSLLSTKVDAPGDCLSNCSQPAKGSITIVKDANPVSLQRFKFVTTGFSPNAPFYLVDTGFGVGNKKTFNNLQPDKTYTVAESGVGDNGWLLDDITCKNQDKSVIADISSGVSIELAAGENITCTFTNRAYGQIIVRKTTDPRRSLQDFTVTASSSNGGRIFGDVVKTVSDSNDAIFKVEPNKTYTITETVPDGWVQAASTCENRTVIDLLPGVGEVPTLYCDILNTKLANLTIVKQTDPSGSLDQFEFLVSRFGQKDETMYLSDGGEKTYSLMPGLGVKVTENLGRHSDWDLTNLDCDTHSHIYINQREGSIAFIPTAGQMVRCTFKNTRHTGTLTVLKQIDGKDVPNGWTWHLEGQGEAIDMGTSRTVPTGWYTFGENEKDGYSFDSLVCKEGKSTVPVSRGATSRIYIGKNDNIICTFTNTRDMGSLTLTKRAYPTSSQEFNFTISGTAVTPVLIDDGTGKNNSSGPISLPTGSYTVSEATVPGWESDGATCNGADAKFENGVLSLNVTKNAVINCTFVNTQLAQLTIVKDAQPNGSRSFGFTSTIPDGNGEDTSFELSDDGIGLANSKAFQDLKPGTYTITETKTDAWKLDDIACTGTGVTTVRDGYKLTVTLAAGAKASCTFVNTFVPQVLGDSSTTLVNTGTDTIIATTIALTLTVTAIVISLQRRRAFETVKKD